MSFRTPVVLIVDDEQSVCRSLVRNLDPLELKAVARDSGPRALEWLREHKTDVIIADQNMPGMDGMEFLKRSKDIQPKAHRLMLTADSNLTLAISAIAHDLIERFITKPWEPDKLRKAMSCLCGLSKCHKLENEG